MKKTFVLDTNVLLHDFNAIYNFQEHDIVIPIVVFEELDKFKKGNGVINFNARQIMRELDKLTANKDTFSDGIELGEGLGKLYIESKLEFSEDLKELFIDMIPDHKILAVAYNLSRKKENVILVSQDINLRLKARSLGIQAEDYKTGKIEHIDDIFKEVNTYGSFDSSLLHRLYTDGFLNIEDAKLAEEPIHNDYFILSDGISTALASYDASKKIIRLVKKHTAYHIKPRNAEQTFALDALLRDDIQLVSLTGRAGTGKTLLALAAALQQADKFNNILLARPIVALSNKDLGYLPGDAIEKVRPYMQPLFDNLNVIKQQSGFKSAAAKKIDEMLQEKKLIIEPLAYIRGRSLADVFFIVDEAQNLTPHEVKTIITRAGENTKIVFTGDIEQIDSPYLDDRSNGLSYLTDKMKGQDLFAHIHLIKGERSRLAELASRLL